MVAANMTREQFRTLGFVALAEFLVLAVWFSASAVVTPLTEAWELSSGQAAWLTLAVQLGFVVGALSIAITNLADSVPTRQLFVWSTVLAVGANAALLAEPAPLVAIGFRFVTGVALAGVYPPGMKVLAGWFMKGRGLALGVMVGALSVGSAVPHLLSGVGLPWRGVVLGSSILAATGAVIMGQLVADGPHEAPSSPFRFDLLSSVGRNRGFRLATAGYLGHMWELYALWTWVGAFLVASESQAGVSYGSTAVITFAVIAIGGPAAWVAGIIADRVGRTGTAGAALAVSGTCAAISPLIFGRTAWVVVPILLIWGAAAVADSAQFSAMVTETTDGDIRGTSLTLQTALGFLLTLVTIRWVPQLAEASGWQYAFTVLALGPALAIAAMVRLRRSPAAALLAGGKG